MNYYNDNIENIENEIEKNKKNIIIKEEEKKNDCDMNDVYLKLNINNTSNKSDINETNNKIKNEKDFEENKNDKKNEKQQINENDINMTNNINRRKKLKKIGRK